MRSASDSVLEALAPHAFRESGWIMRACLLRVRPGVLLLLAAGASGWASEHPDGVLLTVPDAFRYARDLIQHCLDG